MNLDEMIADLGHLVSCESPSSDPAAVARSADAVSALGARMLGTEGERIVVGGCTHLRWRFAGDGPRVLLLGHHDTVWPVGSLRKHPWRVDNGLAYGPGCFDMKAGLVQLFHAVASLPDRSGLTVLVTGDEELGAPSSRNLIEEEAQAAAAALVLEPSADGGALKTARRGVAVYQVRVHGRAAHAGLEPWRGVNATVELAHQVVAIAALDAGPRGTTVTPTVISGGTTTNTVPQHALLQVDVRVPTRAAAELVDAQLRGLRPRLPEARLEVIAGPSHPPLEPAASAALFRMAEQAAARLSLAPLASADVGGGSDGNLTAGIGTPTLDGLGPVGGGAHAPGEHVVISEMPRRARLVAELVSMLRVGPAPKMSIEESEVHRW